MPAVEELATVPFNVTDQGVPVAKPLSVKTSAEVGAGRIGTGHDLHWPPSYCHVPARGIDPNSPPKSNAYPSSPSNATAARYNPGGERIGNSSCQPLAL